MFERHWQPESDSGIGLGDLVTELDGLSDISVTAHRLFGDDKFAFVVDLNESPEIDDASFAYVPPTNNGLPVFIVTRLEESVDDSEYHIFTPLPRYLEGKGVDPCEANIREYHKKILQAAKGVFEVIGDQFPDRFVDRNLRDQAWTERMLHEASVRSVVRYFLEIPAIVSGIRIPRVRAESVGYKELRDGYRLQLPVIEEAPVSSSSDQSGPGLRLRTGVELWLKAGTSSENSIPGSTGEINLDLIYREASATTLGLPLGDRAHDDSQVIVHLYISDDGFWFSGEYGDIAAFEYRPWLSMLLQSDKYLQGLSRRRIRGLYEIDDFMNAYFLRPPRKLKLPR